MNSGGRSSGALDGLIEFCLRNKLVVFVVITFLAGWGIRVAPFGWDFGASGEALAVDAIPDLGENQQIVFTEWKGRSPQDVEDQVTYPLTVSLLGVPGVKTVRSFSMFGFSSIYVIFDESAEFYWSRSRVLEKLNSLPGGTLPDGVQPTLGPDATALGQVFWYTLEGRDSSGNPTGGWGLDELRSIQDWQVRYALLAAEGVSEVASVGGFVREYQVDVDPDALRAFDVTLTEVFSAIRLANVDVGARTIEVNGVEYVIRGLGFIKSLEDIENTVVKVRDNVPVYVRNLANVSYGPALRRGALDKEGVEAVGGVVVARYGANPMAAIENIKAKIQELAPGLPRKTLENGTISQVSIVPFYDRSQLIQETLGTLSSALYEEMLVTIMVVLVMVMHLRASLLISGLLPLSVLLCFVFMKLVGIEANIVALSGIAIAIGTMVDMGIVICENILKRLDEADEGDDTFSVVLRATQEIAPAVLTAVATTVVSFLPVFAMEAAEGKLFRPLAWTKTSALIASGVVSLAIIPPIAELVFRRRQTSISRGLLAWKLPLGVGLGIVMLWSGRMLLGGEPVRLGWWLGILLIGLGLWRRLWDWTPKVFRGALTSGFNGVIVLGVAVILARHWLPLGPDRGTGANILFVTLLFVAILGAIALFLRSYESMLVWCLRHRLMFLSLPALVVFLGMLVWLGGDGCLGWLPRSVRLSPPIVALNHAFPGLGNEFMPALDEGSYLYMPTTMPHASIGESMDAMRKQNLAIRTIPEIESVVGKLGRAETPLDPAPVSMVETIINYHSEYLEDEGGRRLTFQFDSSENDYFRSPTGEPLAAPDGKPYFVTGRFLRSAEGALIPDPKGRALRLWRPSLDPRLNEGRDSWAGIQKPEDIWNEIVTVAAVPGSTSAPKLQPIAARMVMLQSGMRAPMGIKVKGPNLETIESVCLEMERLLKEVPMIQSESVIADRMVGKPYLEIEIDREAIARYGVKLAQVQEAIEVGIGGKQVTVTVEGRERYPVRVRYLRELRDQIETLGRMLVPAFDGAQIPLEQVATIDYRRGPQSIKSEDTFLVGYVLFDGKPGRAEVEVVEGASEFLKTKMEMGDFVLPNGVSFSFAGSYENQVRSEKKLRIVLPVALLLIFVILYLQFKSSVSTLLVFTGILVAWAGGFVMVWCYGQSWFLDVSLLGIDLRELFQVRPFNLSVAIWVGFLALFGIATDNGVLMASCLDQTFADQRPETVAEFRRATVNAGLRRVRPCLMTTATTLLALLPVLTSTGRGSDIMVPMAIPSFGGMLVVLVSIFVVPVIYCSMKEFALRSKLDAGEVAIVSVGSLFLYPLLYVSLSDRFGCQSTEDE